MICASKDYNVKFSSAGEKDMKFGKSQAVKCNKEDRLIRDVNYDKAPSFKTTQGYASPNNANEDFTSSCIKEETLGSQVSLGYRGNGFDFGVDSASIIYDKDSISSTKEAGENYATGYLNRNLFCRLALAENTSTSLEKYSKPVTLLEFHASSGNGLNIIVDLDASPPDLYKRLENEICNCYSAHNNNEFQSLREELEHRFSMPKTDTEKIMKNGDTQADSIDKDSCHGMQFSDTVCQEKIVFCSSPRVSMLKEVPKLNLKESDESAVSRSGVSAEEQEHVNFVSGAESSANFHPIKSLKKRSAVIAGGKRKRSSLEINLRSRTRSMQLAQRVFPRRSMRLVGSQGGF